MTTSGDDRDNHDEAREELPPVQDLPPGAGGLSVGDDLLPEVRQEDARAFATRYASRSWLVLPLHTLTPEGVCSCAHIDCSSAAKHPRTQSGYKNASADLADVEAWWTRWPDANVGIRVGGESGPIVLDVDPRNGGDESLAALLDEYGPMPLTPEVHTGGGGRHLYFARSPELDRITKKTFLPGLDFLVDRAYVVSPPSRHSSGERYEWEKGREPWEIPLAPPPEWLVALVMGQVLPDRRPLEEILSFCGATRRSFGLTG